MMIQSILFFYKFCFWGFFSFFCRRELRAVISGTQIYLKEEQIRKTCGNMGT